MLVALPFAAAVGAPSAPNILLLFPDQWRFDWDGRGTLPLTLPSIRSLAQRGTHFRHAYVPAPVCSPSRSALAAGREYDEAGVANNFHNDYNISIPTFYSSLRAAGFHTMTAGKDDLDKATQLGTRTKQGNWTGDYHQFALGFSDGVRAAGKNDVVDTREPHERYGHWLKQQPLKNGALTGWDGHYTCMKHAHKCTSELFPDALYEDNWTGEQALQLLRGRPADQPFFLQVSFPGPHPPFLVTPKQLSAVAGRTFPGPIDNTDRAAETCAASAQPKSSSSDRCDYAAEIENLDRLIGALVAEVERTDEGLNNTLVCFASDHGEMLGDHGDHGKTMPWQGSASVPLICAGAGVTAGGVVSFPVATLDLAATFVAT